MGFKPLSFYFQTLKRSKKVKTGNEIIYNFYKKVIPVLVLLFSVFIKKYQ